MREVSKAIGEMLISVEDDEPEPDLAASYIADITAQLARLARGAELGILAYLLEMAAAEARGTAESDANTPSAARQFAG